jgi:hypothetical protein
VMGRRTPSHPHPTLLRLSLQDWLQLLPLILSVLLLLLPLLQLQHLCRSLLLPPPRLLVVLLPSLLLLLPRLPLLPPLARRTGQRQTIRAEVRGG